MPKVIHQTGITCPYCDRWKYLGKRKEGKTVFRLCPFDPKEKGKEVEIDSDNPICERFTLADFFFCEKYHHQTSVNMCRNRIRNEKGFKGWEYCEKCFQYRKSICLLVRMIKNGKSDIEESEKPKLKLKRRK